MLWSISILLGALALYTLTDQFQRLTLEQARVGAIDLRYRYREVAVWFAGNSSVYRDIRGNYPPASHPLLWPIIGWASLTTVRWIWAVSSAVMLAWLIALVIRVTGAGSAVERIFIAALVLALNATGQAIGHGQLIVHILPMLLTGFLLLEAPVRGWRIDCVAALLILWTLVQPTISAPFIWIAVFALGGWRPSALIVGGYVALTVFAAAFQFQGDPVAAIQAWMDVAPDRALWSPGYAGGPYANVSTWLYRIGLRALSLPVSVGILVIFGAWVYRNQRANLWLLLGVAAVVARFWTYQRQYNDLVILIPMITLLTLAWSSVTPRTWRAGSGWLFFVSGSIMLTPYSVYFSWPAPWPIVYEATHTISWLLVGAFLVAYTHRAPLASIRTSEMTA